MSALFSKITHWIDVLLHADPSLHDIDVAQELMMRADACAGRDPHSAQELRIAACTFLSVTN